jgi:hypothetical protein
MSDRKISSVGSPVTFVPGNKVVHCLRDEIFRINVCSAARRLATYHLVYRLFDQVLLFDATALCLFLKPAGVFEIEPKLSCAPRFGRFISTYCFCHAVLFDVGTRSGRKQKMHPNRFFAKSTEEKERLTKLLAKHA